MTIKRKTSYRDLFIISIPLLALVVAAFWGAYQFVSSDSQYADLNKELERIIEEVNKLHTPLSNAGQLYNLMVHIDLIKKTVQSKQKNKHLKD